ncbi:MAG TPA: ergothioneine biosynthesis protein EgtB, partial [Polyangiaceae bacterium]|nr:ergothioneine biosynthesis protein EgtB [Polyangiaceae bacterium]
MLAERYRAVRSFTLALTIGLGDEDCVVQSMPDASPTKWHLAHTTWFFERFVLARAMPERRPFHPRFDYLFNSYYEGVGDRHPRASRGMLTRPTLEEVRRYRNHVDDAMLKLLDDPRCGTEITLAVTLGLEHERQHQELLVTDIKHAFFCNPLRPAYRDPAPVTRADGAEPLSWTRFAEGVGWIGHDAKSGAFAFDNEQPRHRVFVEAFELASRPVTNAEYAEFILDSGYEKPELWLSDGWAKVRELGWKAPLYWVPLGPLRGLTPSVTARGPTAFTLHGERAIEPSAPVSHVSYYEADA